VGVKPEPDSNGRTKECVELVPRVVRTPGSEKPTSFSQLLKVTTADTDNDIEYNRNKDKICKFSAQDTWVFDPQLTSRKYELMMIFVSNDPQKNRKRKGR